MSTDVPPPTPSPPTRPAGTINPSALPDDPAVLKQMIAELLRALRSERRDREALERRLDALLRRYHAARPTDPNQPLLFAPPDEAVPPPPPPPPDEAKSKQRGTTNQPHGRRRPSGELRHEPRRYELTETERRCPECGHQRAEIGVETTCPYDYKPAEVFVIEHQRVKYACKCCQGEVVIAAKPPQPINRGLPGPGLGAQLIVDKYQDHIPLYRSEGRFARLGFTLPRSTMCDWMAAFAQRLTPLYRLLVRHVLQSRVLHTDDTTVPVRDETQAAHRYGRLWDYIGDAGHPGVVFDYTATHARDGPVAFLKDFRGYLQADAYGGYDGIYTGSQGAIIEVACWAHARNKFRDAESTDPERALAALAWVRKLYDVEDEAKAAIARLHRTGGRCRCGLPAPAAGEVGAAADIVWSVAVGPEGKGAAQESGRRGHQLCAEPVASAESLHQRRRPAHRQQYFRADVEVGRHRSQQLVVCRQRCRRPDGGGAVQFHGNV